MEKRQFLEQNLKGSVLAFNAKIRGKGKIIWGTDLEVEIRELTKVWRQCHCLRIDKIELKA